MSDTVEVRLPCPRDGYGGKAWVKHVMSVSETTKTGRDWHGEFLDAGRLADLHSGDLIVACGYSGSRKHECKDADLYIVLPSGKLLRTHGSVSNELAIKLRKPAFRYLALEPLSRLRTAIVEEIEFQQTQAPAPSPALVTARQAKVDGLLFTRDFIRPMALQEMPADRVAAMTEQTEKYLASLEEVYAKQVEEHATNLFVLNDLLRDLDPVAIDLEPPALTWPGLTPVLTK